ncbi:MAG: DNA polymerase III subunit delta [Bacilli bacterium]|nr:DNA polymerase III subunit delta [Bacilli bacterium]
MTYLIYGKEDYLIDKEIEKVISKNKIDKNSISNYDDKVFAKDIIEDAKSISLFSPNKAIIVLGDIFDQETTKLFENYLKNENISTFLIIVLRQEKIDERKKIFKLIKNKIECNKVDLLAFVKEELNGYKITESLQRKILDKVGSNIYNIKNELDKIKLYKIDSKEINEEDIKIISKNVEDNVFDFVDNVIKGNVAKTLEIYRELIKKNNEPIAIIVILANQIRLMYQSKILNQSGITYDSIASQLSIHPYRVKLALEKGRSYSLDTLSSLLEKLADLDIKIKSGLVEPNIGLELFLLEL